MTDLTAWLLERIAEDEAAAHAVVDDMPRWDSPSWEDAALEVGDSLPGPRFNARMSPARVLAECAAHRAIVAEHAPIEVYREQPLVCATCVKVDEGGSYITTDTEDVFPCPTIRALASVYADHPDYREEWL